MLSHLLSYRDSTDNLPILKVKYRILLRIACALFYIEKDTEILLVHFTWKVAEKGFKMALMMNKLAMINSCEIIIGK
jgi:hypothetical protein